MMRSASLVFADSIVTLIIKTALFVIFIFSLGSAAQGLLFLYMSAVGVASAISLLGLESTNNFLAARTHFRGLGALFGNSMLLSVLLGLCGAASIVASWHSGWFAEFSSTQILMLAAHVVIANSGFALCGILSGLGRFKERLVGSILALIVTVLGTALLASTGKLTVNSGIALYVLGNFIQSTSYIFAISRVQTMSFRMSLMRWQVIRSIKLYPYFALSSMMVRVNGFIISSFLGLHAVSIYSIATSVMELFLYLPKALASIVLNRAVQGEKIIVTLLKNLLTIMSISILCGTFFLLSILFAVKFKYYIEISMVILLLVPGIIAFGQATTGAYHLLGIGRLKACTAAALVGLVAVVVLNITLIPSFGIAGAAAATSLSYIAFMLVVLIGIVRAEHVHMRDILMPSAEAVLEVISRLRRTS